MRSLLYDIAADCCAMPGIALEYGYWQIRMMGVSDADLVRGTITCAGVGCLALASAVYPEARWQGGPSFAVLPILDRGIIWIFKQRWFTAVRKGLLISTAIGSFILLLLTPGTRSQQEPFSIPAVVARHDTDIAALKETIQEMRADVRALKRDQEDFFWWLKCIGIAALTTFIGLTLTRYHADAERGRMERERGILRKSKAHHDDLDGVV